MATTKCSPVVVYNKRSPFVATPLLLLLCVFQLSTTTTFPPVVVLFTSAIKSLPCSTSDSEVVNSYCKNGGFCWLDELTAVELSKPDFVIRCECVDSDDLKTTFVGTDCSIEVPKSVQTESIEFPNTCWIEDLLALNNYKNDLERFCCDANGKYFYQ
eukprot:GHVS01019782.1.p1 GENE.GHVS01019782.1~~GHVS01019782.1.p1  ORF type:complete len:157 (-),score=28.22 GHVS01019782.1:54-524(-)